MNKPYLFGIICCLFVQLLQAHNGNDHGQIKRWTIELNGKSSSIDGYFYLYKDGKVLIEKANQKIIVLPIESLSRKDRFNVMERYAEIQILNEKLKLKKHLRKQSKALATTLLVATDPLSVDAAFKPFKPNVGTRWDANYFYVESNGLPTTHVLMKGITGWQQQFPIPQCYTGTNAWSIPLNPTIATTPVPVNANHFTRGAIAVAVNGIAIFNPFTNTGVDALVDGQLDEYGGHCGRADDYHYHIAPLSLYDYTAATLPIAYALDGFAVYGAVEPDGTPMKTLDLNHGHLGTNGVYHYHGTKAFPYMIGNMVGKVTEDATMQIIPQAAAKSIRPAGTPLKGAVITGCVPNASKTGYTLSYTLSGQNYSVEYSWTPSGVFTFNFNAPTGTTTSKYNGTSVCTLTGSSGGTAGSVLKTMLRLPDTGQSTSYTSSFGEDNDYTINAPFFINNGNGTITDTITGLMWQRGDGGEMTIEKATTYCDTLKLAGYSDWRLPSPFEAFSILNHQRSNPSIDITQFVNTGAEYWWTNTAQSTDASKIWVTNAGGGIGNHFKTETVSAGGTKKIHARAVRTPFTPQTLNTRFVDNGNGTVTDQLSNLVWEKVPNTSALTWEQALTYAENLTLAGASDWRVPNIKEIQSLNDFSAVNPAINVAIFSTIGVKKYWSSTTLPNQTTRAWYWDTQFGITTYDLKTVPNYLICVRSNKAVSTGLRQIDPELESLRIHPNPADDAILLYFEGESSREDKNLLLSNVLGQVLQQSKILAAHKTKQINTTALENGWYFLTLQKGEAIKTFKILIQH